MPKLMPPREYVTRYLASLVAPYLPDYLPPSTPRLVTLSLTEIDMRIEATPPTLDAGVASIELHYTPFGGTEAVLSLVADPVEFEVDSVGSLSYFAVAVGINGVKSDPTETLAFDVTDQTKPAVPGNVTLRQVG